MRSPSRSPGAPNTRGRAAAALRELRELNGRAHLNGHNGRAPPSGRRAPAGRRRRRRARSGTQAAARTSLGGGLLPAADTRWRRRRRGPGGGAGPRVYGGGAVRPGCQALPVGRGQVVRRVLQGADQDPPHLLRPGLEAPHQLPVPLHRRLHDAQRAAAGGWAAAPGRPRAPGCPPGCSPLSPRVPCAALSFVLVTESSWA